MNGSCSTRMRLLESLRRRGPRTAAELAREFDLSPMAVRLQMLALVEQGFARATHLRGSRGRPARVWEITAAARCLFPQKAGPMALELLAEVEAGAGREAVVTALRRRGERMAEGYLAATAGQDGREKVRTLARLRDEEGYLCEAEFPGRAEEIVERHCPIAPIAERWPEVCAVEAEVFARVLGRPVRRVEYALDGDGCCRYRVGKPV